jgi:hypothetical protein
MSRQRDPGQTIRKQTSTRRPFREVIDKTPDRLPSRSSKGKRRMEPSIMTDDEQPSRKRARTRG